jgi:hypothetical protein
MVCKNVRETNQGNWNENDEEKAANEAASDLQSRMQRCTDR